MSNNREAGKGFPPGGRTRDKKKFDEGYEQITWTREDRCKCLCHTKPGMSHIVPCCDKPPYELREL